MPQIVLPHNGWRPRSYQQPMWDAWQKEGKDRVIQIAHRRWGKDEVFLHGAAIKAHERPANYWHCFPEYAMARKGIWNAVNPHTGKRRIDEAFPHELRSATNNQEMLIQFKVGSSWQVIGSDNYNTLVGGGVAGITFSEWALCNPSAWAYMRPMLQENNGWAGFISTPRGRNHAKAMYERALSNPSWYADLSGVQHTGALTGEQLEEALGEYIDIFGEEIGAALLEQEYYCSFNAAIIGAFYAREMRRVRSEERICEIEALPGRPVHRAWDIGVSDDTSIWWFQVVGPQIYLLDCHTSSGAGVDFYAELCAEKAETHGWIQGVDYVPHDAGHRHFGTIGARSTVEQMQRFGMRPELAPSMSKQDGINAARKTLARCVFHPRCEDVGVSALELYRREWDDKRKVFRKSEVHDWASHPADAFRYLSLCWRSAPAFLADVEAPVAPQTGFVLTSPDDDRNERGIKV